METKINEKLMAINGEPPLKIGMQASGCATCVPVGPQWVIGMYHLRPQWTPRTPGSVAIYKFSNLQIVLIAFRIAFSITGSGCSDLSI